MPMDRSGGWAQGWMSQTRCMKKIDSEWTVDRPRASRSIRKREFQWHKAKAQTNFRQKTAGCEEKQTIFLKWFPLALFSLDRI